MGVRGILLRGIADKLVTILIITSLLTIPLSMLGSPTLLKNSNKFSLEQGDYTPVDQIHLWSNEDFVTMGIPGSGSADDPYRIEGFEISTLQDDLIFISGTDVFFEIKNNLISGENSNNLYGIRLINTKNGVIENNILREADQIGILIVDSQNIVVENNFISNNNLHGLELQNSTDIIIRNNIINTNKGDGIASYFSENNIIVNNSLSQNDLNGIRIENSGSHILLENSIDLNGEGGIFFGGALFNSAESNIISNNPIGVNFEINGGELSESVNNTVISNVIINNDNGILLTNGIGNTITGNLIDQNSFESIAFDNGENNKLRQNIISRGGVGFVSRGFSYNNTLTCNLFEENLGYGVFIGTNSENEWVYQNDFVDNQNNPQALDIGSSNTFGANYWSDIGNQDQNEDGINDIQYVIDGSTKNADYASSPVRNINPDDENSICKIETENLIVTLPPKPEVLTNVTGEMLLETTLELPISNSVLFIISSLTVFTIATFILYKRKSR